MKKLKKNTKPRNFLIKDLMSPKYRLRVASSVKLYDRKANKQILKKELSYG